MNELKIKEDITRWILEDIPFWDSSSSHLVQNKFSAKVIAKQSGMISGTAVVRIFADEFGLHMDSIVKEGTEVENGAILFVIEGQADKLLAFERTCLNIYSHMCGISTATSNLVKIIQSNSLSTRIAATRKTLPGLRMYQKWAVKIGGGDTHRMSLSSMVMLKENHLSMFDSIKEAIDKTRSEISFSQKIEVECTNDNEALEAARAGADIIMLDNYSPALIKSIITKVKEIKEDLLVEASGNITEVTLFEYAKSGVDIISLGGLTHSSKVFDMSMIFNNN